MFFYLMLEKAGLKPEGTDFKPEGTDLKLERADFVPESLRGLSWCL